MIKIIAGKYKGHKLFEMKSARIRPTSARVRKSVMQILEPLSGCRVLDLFAGSGILGLEALSRGADSVVFVENDYHAVKLLNRNLGKICNGDGFTIYHSDVYSYVNQCEDTYDIIIADPPYNNSYKYKLMQEIVQPILEDDGMFCMEMEKTPIDGIHSRVKYYGNTQVVFWRYVA